MSFRIQSTLVKLFIVNIFLISQFTMLPAYADQHFVKVITSKNSPFANYALNNLKEEISKGTLYVDTSTGVRALPLELEFIEDGAQLLGKSVPEFQLLSGNKVSVAVTLNQTNDLPKVGIKEILRIIGDGLNCLCETRSKESKTNLSVKKSAHIGFLSTGEKASRVPLQTPDSFLKIKTRLLDKWKISTQQISILFGAGPNSNQRNTQSFDLDANRPVLIKFEGLDEKAAFNYENLKGISQYADELAVKFKIWVLGGHGNKGVVPIWGGGNLTKEQFSEATTTSSAKNILVSGTCYGASFSTSVAAGFFEASPYTMAGACNNRPDQIPTHTYLVDFFAAADNAAEADFDKDGKVSLSEAHWYASKYAYWDVTYTKMDALAEEYFETQSKETQLRSSFSIEEYTDLINQFADIGETSFNSEIMKSINRYGISRIFTKIGGENQETQEGVTKLRASQMLRRMLLRKYCEQNPRSDIALRVKEVAKIERESLKALF